MAGRSNGDHMSDRYGDRGGMNVCGLWELLARAVPATVDMVPAVHRLHAMLRRVALSTSR